MPDRRVWFGVGLGAWNGADSASAAESARLAAQADNDGLDLFTVADHPYFGEKLDAYALLSFLRDMIVKLGVPRLERGAAVLEQRASGFIYRSTDDTPAAEALARWAREIVPAVREAIGQ
jgi:hypothetical protein